MIFRQFVRYAILGFGNVTLDFIIYIGLTRGFSFWEMHYLYANAVSFIIVVTLSFFANKYWAFEERSGRHLPQYFRFFFVTLGSIGIAEGILALGVEVFMIHDILAKAIIIPLVFVWNFSLYRFWVFASP